MNTLLFSLLLWIQGIPIQPTQGGTVTGTLRGSDGKAAVGVRVAAVPQTDTIEAAAAGPTLSSIAETDAEGRYKLENIPPGRYYIAAGRLDLPTYYPGTQSMAVGQAVGITPGATIQGIDFTLQATSAGRADAVPFGVTLLNVPLDVHVEGEGKLPIFAGGKQTTLQLTPINGGAALSVPINAARISLSPPITDYRITVEGLPEGYRVKSMMLGPTNLADGVLKVSGISVINGNVSWFSSTAAGGFAIVVPIGSNRTPAVPQLLIMLDSMAASTMKSAGVLVSGHIPAGTFRPIYLSGVPGTLFSDGTFEFRNVAAGRHMILSPNDAPSKPALAASIIVGDVDLNGVELESTPVLPQNPRALSAPAPAGTRRPGSLPLASLHGRILDAETGMPLSAGTTYIVGDSWARYEIGKDGTFEFLHLLPGTYELEVQGVGYPTIRRTVIVEEKDLDIELKAG
jgi:Carboxypeptidase regulatory-like domain